MPWVLAAVLAAASLASAADAPADAAARRLKALESELARARAEGRDLGAARTEAEAELERIGARAAEVAKRMQQAESEASALDIEIAALAQTESDMVERLAESRAATARVLGAMQRLARRPTEALLVSDEPPADAVRTAVLLRAAVPALKDQAGRLRESLAALTRTRRRKAGEQAALAKIEESLGRERIELARLATDKTALFQELRADELAALAKAQSLAREAHDLKELMERIEAERRARAEAEARRAKEAAQRRAAEEAARNARPPEAGAPPSAPERPFSSPAPERPLAPPAPERPFSSPAPERPLAPPAPERPLANVMPPVEPSPRQGAFLLPAAGTVVGQYGEAAGPGQSRKGIEIEARPGAQVVAPYAGRVVFAGPFRGYGRLLIIEHADGYHSLLAGLGRIDSALGQTLVTGEPVGVMASETASRPILYLELRREGQPVNPLPWLAARKRNGNG